MNTRQETLSRFCNEVGHCQINSDAYFACANFLFYASWFEERLFSQKKGEHQSPENTKKIAAYVAGKIDLSSYDAYGNYFCNRYLNGSMPTHHFSQLQLSSKHSKNVQTALQDFLDTGKRDSELLWSYLMIAYRFRNNMFHGSKKLINLNTYVEQFDLLNRFWDQLLRDIDNIGYLGFNQSPKP